MLVGCLAMMAGCGTARADDRRTDLMIVGDSISAPWRYNATGENGRIKAWWAYVADSAGIDSRHGLAVKVDAVPGTGMLATGPVDSHAVKNLDASGEACGDDTPGMPDRSFATRLDDISLTKPPRVLIIEGGRNDFKKCVDGITRPSTVAESKAAIDGYMARLAARVEAARMSTADVFVVTPWGTTYPKQRQDIVPLVEAAARARDFNWIPTPVLEPQDTVDGTHPDAAGTAWLAHQIESRSDLVSRLKENAGP